MDKFVYDIFHTIEVPTFVLSNVYHHHIGVINNIDLDSIDIKFNMATAQEVSCDVYKELNGSKCDLWDKIVGLRYVFIPEFKEYYKIDCSLDENNEIVKHLTLTSAGEYELSNKKILSLEINTESDILQDDYITTVFYDENNPRGSLLDRALADKAPDWSIGHVDETLKTIQRTFSVNNQSIYDFLTNTVAKEINCLFLFDSVKRKISAYDLLNKCSDCGYRGEMLTTCTKCGSTNLIKGYGKDSNIFISADNYAEKITVDSNEDAVKNCFRVTGGDDYMNATIRNCNPNGSHYIYNFSEADYEDMPPQLTAKLIEYGEKYDELLPEYQEVVADYYDNLNSYYFYKTSMMPRINGTHWEAEKGYDVGDEVYVKTLPSWCYLECIQSGISGTTEFDATRVTVDQEFTDGTVIWQAKKNIITVPSAEQSLNDIKDYFAKNDVYFQDNIPKAITEVNNEVKNIAGLTINNIFRIEVILDDYNKVTDGVWIGNIKVYNTGNTEDTITTDEPLRVNVRIAESLPDYMQYMSDKVEKRLSKVDTTFTELFKIEIPRDENYNYIAEDDTQFKEALHEYGLDMLSSFSKSYQGCIETLISNGITDDKSSLLAYNLYNPMYVPYYARLGYISDEMAVRQATVDEYEAAYKDAYNKMQEYHKELDMKTFLGDELYKTLYNYIREDEYNNNNYISDGLSDGEVINDAKKLLEIANDELVKANTMQYTLSDTLVNLFNTKEFKDYKDSFRIGDYIICEADERLYRLRLIGVSYSYNSPDKINLTFSNFVALENYFSDAQNILSTAKTMSTSYGAVMHQVDKSADVTDEVSNWKDEGLSSATTTIKNNDNEEVIIDENGILAREYDDVTQTYSDEQMRITHNIIAFTDDAWETSTLGIGKQAFIYYSNDPADPGWKEDVGYGLNAKFVNSGYITGTQIVAGDIYSNKYEAGHYGSHINLNDGSFDLAGGGLIGRWNSDTHSYDLNYTGDVEGVLDVGVGSHLGTWTVYDDGLYSGVSVLKPDNIYVTGNIRASDFQMGTTMLSSELARLDSAKQDKLIAGDNIEIINNVISATGGGQGLEYWEETSEDFSREETSELPDRFTANSEYIFTDSEWSVTDKTTGEVYRAYKKQTGRAICGRFIYWDYQFGAYYKPFYGYAYISTVEDYVKYSQGGSTTPWGTKTINGVTFYVSSNINFCSPNDYNLVHDDVPYIGEFESYSDAVDKLIELADIKAGNQYLNTGIGIGENIIWGGNRYDEEDDFPFYVDNEGKIHAKSITVDSVTAEKINAEEVISDEHNVLADFVGATGSADGVHGLVPAPTTNDVGKVLFADGWRSIGTDLEDIFSIFDTTNINSQYSSGTLTSDSFSFSVNENSDSWSASATAYNNTAFDITDYNTLVIDVDVTEQSDYGAFWVTLSQTKYTWGTGSWVGVYYNVDSAIKITESGQYEIDVSALSGDYYIYIGASTGKDTVARGDCVNNQNGKIIGTVTAFKGIKLNGIVPNPTESATNKLKKIKIEDVVYEIADIEGVTEEEYADLPSTKNSDNVLYMVRSVEDIFDGGSTITLLGSNGVTLQESAVSGNVGTLKAYEYSAGHEGFNIALKNLTIGNTYKLEFDFQFTSAQFIGTDYRCAYLISATQKTNYSDYGQWTENIPRNLQKHHHSVEFTATVTTMYVAFNLDGCSDSVNNYFTMSNIYVIDVASKNKIMYNGNQYGASAGGGASAVSDLTDVDLTNLSNGQILKYNLTTQKWENANESGGTTVVANPTGTATADLNKIQVGNTIYQIPQGGGGGGSFELGLKYDFTKSALDVLSLTPITLENVTQTNNGLTFNASNSYAYFSGNMLKRNTVYEFEVVSLNITDTSRHNDLFRYQNVGSNQNAGLIYRYQTLKWSVWDSTNGWQDSDISDKDYFNNSVVKVKILDDGKWEIYKDDVLVFAPPLAMVFEGTDSFGLGSPNASATSMTIKSFRAYVDGYKEESGGGSGVELVEYDYAKFNGTGGITLPYTINADYTIEVEFDTPTYYNDMAVIGNTDGGGGRSHLTMYSSRWYCSVGNGSEGNFAESTTGRHTFITNKDNSNYFDGNVVTAYNPYSTSNNYQIGARGNGHYLNGKIYHYKISSISTGDTILDLVPAKLLAGGIEIKSGLYDKITKKFFDGNFITEIDND